MAKNYGKKEEEVLKNEQLRKYVEENMKTEKAKKSNCAITKLADVGLTSSPKNIILSFKSLENIS